MTVEMVGYEYRRIELERLRITLLLLMMTGWATVITVKILLTAP
jgi:hypothetical protein